MQILIEEKGKDKKILSIPFCFPAAWYVPQWSEMEDASTNKLDITTFDIH